MLLVNLFQKDNPKADGISVKIHLKRIIQP